MASCGPSAITDPAYQAWADAQEWEHQAPYQFNSFNAGKIHQASAGNVDRKVSGYFCERQYLPVETLCRRLSLHSCAEQDPPLFIKDFYAASTPGVKVTFEKEGKSATMYLPIITPYEVAWVNEVIISSNK